MRALGIAVLLCGLAIGCGDSGGANDMTLVLDLTGGPLTCGIDDVTLACPGPCAACLYVSLPGLCVTPCHTAMTSECPTGQSCHLANVASDGSVIGSVQFAGACAGYDGYCG
jgi:hypothetical protein